MKALVAYYSRTGTTDRVARMIKDALEARGVDVTLKRIVPTSSPCEKLTKKLHKTSTGGCKVRGSVLRGRFTRFQFTAASTTPARSILRMLNAAHISSHSDRAFASPLNRNCRSPKGSLIVPNAGSTDVCLNL